MTKLLDVAALRHRVLAQNVANVNTPGYHRLEVSFEAAFAKAYTQDRKAALNVAPKIVEAPGGVERLDGNNVDIDAEMGRLSNNALLYNVYTQILLSRIGAERTAITSR
jgi:flagellar basal-body rod protein FlgB